MNSPKIVLLDFDNTLVDFNECARQSIIDIFKKFDFEYNENVYETFIRENVKIWKRLEKGEITKEQLRADRWNIILKKLGIDFDGKAFEELFENGVASYACPVKYAYELLDYLKEKYPLYVVSNGFRAVQESRLKIGNFEKYFQDVFVSEDVGVAKPDKRFFDYVFSKLGTPDKSDVILIGDSFFADIVGGSNYGIKTIWFNKTREGCPDNTKPTYTASDLSEIKNIL